MTDNDRLDIQCMLLQHKVATTCSVVFRILSVRLLLLCFVSSGALSFWLFSYQWWFLYGCSHVVLGLLSGYTFCSSILLLHFMGDLPLVNVVVFLRQQLSLYSFSFLFIFDGIHVVYKLYILARKLNIIIPLSINFPLGGYTFCSLLMTVHIGLKRR